MMLDEHEKTRISQVLDLLSTPPENLTGPQWRQVRLIRGLTMSEVQRQLGLSAFPIMRLEGSQPNAGPRSAVAALSRLYRIPIQRPRMPWEDTA